MIQQAIQVPQKTDSDTHTASNWPRAGWCVLINFSLTSSTFMALAAMHRALSPVPHSCEDVSISGQALVELPIYYPKGATVIIYLECA